MTPEETEVLARIGSASVMNLMRCSLDFLLWGIHAILSIAALISIWRRGLTGRPAKILFAALGSVFLLNTFSVVVLFTNAVQALQKRFIHHLDLPFEERLLRAAQINRTSLSKALTYISNISGLIYIIGDVVILWRAWNIWLGKKVLLMIPCFFVFAAFAFSLTSNTLSQRQGGPEATESLYAITGIMAETCSLVANLVTTAMIGLQVYQHRKLMKEAFGSHRLRSWKIMLFLTEAGVVYLIIQSVAMGLNIPNTVSLSPLDYSAQVWMRLTLHLSASYPAIVVLMTHYNHSLASDTMISRPTGDIGTHISFARPQANGTLSHKTQVTNEERSSHHPSRGIVSVSDQFEEPKGVNGDEEKSIAVA